MKNYLALPLFLLTTCKPANDKLVNVFVNECDAPAIRAQYHAAVQETIEIPICIHTVYPDEATRDTLEVEGTEEEESTDDAYTRIYVEGFNTFMAGYNPYTVEQNGLDTKIGLYEFAPRDIIVNAEWGTVNDYSDSDPEGEIVRHDLAAANNTEGCVNLYIIKNDFALSEKFGYATYPNDTPQDNFVMLWDTESNKLAHEFGHVLALLHTDEPNGDHLDDTPYDPGSDYCYLEADGSEVFGVCDAPYEEYGPDLPFDNIMAPYEWYNVFTKQQLERMHCTWARHEDNIFLH